MATRRSGKWTYYRLADGGGGSAEAEILSWLLRQLRDDPKILGDTIRFAEIRARIEAGKKQDCLCGRKSS